MIIKKSHNREKKCISHAVQFSSVRTETVNRKDHCIFQMWEKEKKDTSRKAAKQYFIVKHVQLKPLCMLGIALNCNILIII